MRALLCSLLLVLTAACSAPPRDFGAGFAPPLSVETGAPVTGWGGGGSGGLHHTPILFVHGNTVEPDYWLPAREFFRNAGYSDDELWAVGYGHRSVLAFDSADLSVPTLDAFVEAVAAQLYRKTGRRVERFDIVAHSLGVTLVRQWMQQTNSAHRVRNFIAVAGANHGVLTGSTDARGPNRLAALELAPGGGWLAQLNRGGETPGPLRYRTIYDGTGNYDVLFPGTLRDSSALQGADNIAFNRERGGHLDHLELPLAPATLQLMLDFVHAAPEPQPGAALPRVAREGERLIASQPGAQLHCTQSPALPNLATPPVTALDLAGDSLWACFAHNPSTALAGPLERHQYRIRTFAASPPLTLQADTPAGDYENPLRVSLKASDAAAWITYSTAGRVPDTGGSLYAAPVYLAASGSLIAIAHAPDGRVSQPLRLDYRIGPRVIRQTRGLLRQIDP